MKKRLRFQMPHVPLKVLRGQQDEEDLQDQLYERFVPPTTTTATEDDNNDDNDNDDNSVRSRSSFDDIGNVSDDGMKRYLGEHTDSLHSTSQSNTASWESVGDFHSNKRKSTGYQTTGSVSHEAIELQAFADVHQPPNTDTDTDNISEEAMGGYLGRHTSSIDNSSQSDIDSDEDIGLHEFAQVHHPPDTDNNAASISNVSEEAVPW